MDRRTHRATGRKPPESGWAAALLARCLNFAWRRPPRPRPAHLKDVVAIRSQLLLTIEDCSSVAAHRLRLQIERARTPQELWLLRNDAFSLIAQRHDQRTAAQRIDALVKAFDGWLDPKQLARIG